MAAALSCITAVIWAQYLLTEKIHGSLKGCQSSGLVQILWSWFGLTLQAGHLSTWFLFLLLKMDFPAHPPPCYNNPQLYKQQIHGGIDPYQFRQEGSLGLQWNPSQPRLVSHKLEGLPASPEPTVTQIPLSSLCVIFIGMRNWFQGAKRLVKVSLAV